jgi:hypothetical protein
VKRREPSSLRNPKSDSDETDPIPILRDLPERYFALMEKGSKLAKEGQFSKAAQQFADARAEGSHILHRLLELPKSSHATSWQIITVLWAFKLLKSVFYWLLAQSEISDAPSQRQSLLLAAVGAQYVGQDMIAAFEGLDEALTGTKKELLSLLAEAIRNFEDRQGFLDQELATVDAELSRLLGYFGEKRPVKPSKNADPNA